MGAATQYGLIALVLLTLVASLYAVKLARSNQRSSRSSDGLIALVLLTLAATVYAVKLARSNQRSCRSSARALRRLRRGHKAQGARTMASLAFVHLSLERLLARSDPRRDPSG